MLPLLLLTVCTHDNWIHGLQRFHIHRFRLMLCTFQLKHFQLKAQPRHSSTKNPPSLGTMKKAQQQSWNLSISVSAVLSIHRAASQSKRSDNKIIELVIHNIREINHFLLRDLIHWWEFSLFSSSSPLLPLACLNILASSPSTNIHTEESCSILFFSSSCIKNNVKQRCIPPLSPPLAE